jgi:hypothetical protein
LRPSRSSKTRIATLPDRRKSIRQPCRKDTFFEGRFKSIAILDEGSLLATCAYIDLNPLAAGIAALPEASAHTSIKERVDHVAAQGRTEDLKAARTSSAVASKQAAGLEEDHWLCPVEDRRRIDSTREGMIEGFALGSYVLLVDYTARLFRKKQTDCTRSPGLSILIGAAHNRDSGAPEAGRLEPTSPAAASTRRIVMRSHPARPVPPRAH